ncbi:hypothetical protein BGZ61DRAFT_234879 [Ilyonectria robusta]|uniref:uncharacterized protein n=1 Tax=Ilyonectria robusta TaxID=1079257 RepID=UPI001E8D1858|nr:uncharacterized protein BGZ61DRAFT_234879 [Ilyonectria robusta]KAH8699646.1 hypothetical protein BGZ61DRAFT_234879 [Ilyonectria robusta]
MGETCRRHSRVPPPTPTPTPTPIRTLFSAASSFSAASQLLHYQLTLSHGFGLAHRPPQMPIGRTSGLARSGRGGSAKRSVEASSRLRPSPCIICRPPVKGKGKKKEKTGKDSQDSQAAKEAKAGRLCACPRCSIAQPRPVVSLRVWLECSSIARCIPPAGDAQLCSHVRSSRQA